MIMDHARGGVNVVNSGDSDRHRDFPKYVANAGPHPFLPQEGGRNGRGRGGGHLLPAGEE